MNAALRTSPGSSWTVQRAEMPARLGQAATLSGPLWQEWRDHLRRTAPVWVWVAVTLTHVLCCRISEVLGLKAKDFNFQQKWVKIKALKRAPAVRKPLLQAALPLLRKLQTSGKSTWRLRGFGARGKKRVREHWQWPKSDGYLFPNQAHNGPMSKDRACHAIARARTSFCPRRQGPGPLLSTQSIRSHTGRHRMINDMKKCNISADAGMVFARIKHKRTYDLYGRMDQVQTGKVLNANKGLKRTLKEVYG